MKTITNCHSSVSISRSSINMAGGIVGYNCSGRVYNCYNIGTINANINVGGINGASGASWGKACYTYNCYDLGSTLEM